MVSGNSKSTENAPRAGTRTTSKGIDGKRISRYCCAPLWRKCALLLIDNLQNICTKEYSVNWWRSFYKERSPYWWNVNRQMGGRKRRRQMVMSSLGYSPLSINLSASAPSLNRMEAAFRFWDNDLILNDNNTILLRSNFFRVEIPLKNYQGKYGQKVENLHHPLDKSDDK